MNNLHLMNNTSEEPYEVINDSLENNMSSNVDSSTVEESTEDDNIVNDEESNDEYDEEDEDEYEDEEEEYENQEYNKWKYSILGGLVFFVLSSPTVYKMVNVLLNNSLQVINKDGCPTMVGLLIHSLVYILLIRAMMNLNI